MKNSNNFMIVLAALAWGFFTVITQAQTVDDIPQHYYKEPGLYPHRDYVNQHFNEHIDPFSGTLNLHYVDLYIPGNGGFDLKVERRYSSMQDAPYTGGTWINSSPLIGLSWSVHFGRVLNVGGGCPNFSQAVLELPNGDRQTFYHPQGGNPYYLSPSRWKGHCQRGGPGGGFIFYSPDGVRYDMTVYRTELIMGTGLGQRTGVWYPSRIEDRYGNAMTFAYDGPGANLSSVTTNDDRQINFSYTFRNGFYYVQTVSGAGRTWTYSYQTAGLTQAVDYLQNVIRPDGTLWQYNYYPDRTPSPGSYSLQTLTYPQGGAISYGYGHVEFNSSYRGDKTTVVTSKTTGDPGGSWSFSYDPGSPGVPSTTTVGTPAGTITYKHFGYNTISNGTVWMMGLLKEKHSGNVQSEYYEWDRQYISPEWVMRPPGYDKNDNGTYAPILTRKTIVRDNATYRTTYSDFDTYGNPRHIDESGPAARTTLVSYYFNFDKWIIKQVRDENISSIGLIGRFFNDNGFLIIENRFGVATSFTPTPQGDIAIKTNARGKSIRYESYYRGIPRTENWPESVLISRNVSAAGNVMSETDGEGRTTTYDYDGLDRISYIGYPIRNSVSISYTSNTKSLSRGSYREQTVYDGYGRPRSISRGGIVQSFQYDPLGRKMFESFPGSSSGMSYSYDILGRVRSVGHPGGTKSINFSGASMSVTNERAKTTTYSFRAYGNPDDRVVTGITTPESGASIVLGRNGLGQITFATQGGITRNYGYSSKYFLETISDPETGTTAFGRDEVGNMTSHSVGGSGTTSFEIDGLNRTTEIRYPGSSTPHVSLRYNKNSKLTRVASTIALRTFDYDENSNLKEEVLTIDDFTFATAYGYDGNDALSTVTYPRTGRVVSYEPNILGRPTKVSPYASSVAYYPSGNLQSVALENGKTIVMGENNRQLPDSVRVPFMIDKSYSYDGVGNATGISDGIEAIESLVLGYDDIDRLTVANGPWGQGTISYDGVGNITSQRLGDNFNLTYAYVVGNRLGSVSGGASRNFTYDVYGNVARNGRNVFDYDDAGNLRRVDPGTAGEVKHDYDGKNMRVRTEKNSVRTYNVYSASGDLLLEFTPADGNATKEHIYLRGKRIASRYSDSRVASTTTVAASPNPVRVGDIVTLTATVTGRDPTGAITFRDGATELAVQRLSRGVATFSTDALAEGQHNISAIYTGDVNNTASTSSIINLRVDPDTRTPSTTSLLLTPNPSIVSQTVTMTATVSGSSPTGTVVFRDGQTVLGTVSVSAGIARFTTAALAIGNHPITARYSGDNFNKPSVSLVQTQRVNEPPSCPVPTTTQLTASDTSVRVGSEITFTATVIGYNVRGSVGFYDGEMLLATVEVVNDRATYPVRFQTAGQRDITARYLGDGCNQPSVSSALNITVERFTTYIQTSSSPANPEVGQAVTLSAQIFNSYFATGTVTFKEGATTLGRADVTYGSASLMVSTFSVGTHNVVSEYSGDINNTPSTSSPELVIVHRATTTTTLTSNMSTSMIGQMVTFTATIRGYRVTGTVTFKEGATTLGTANVSGGLAVFNISSLSLGSHTIVAEYGGDANNHASVSGALPHTVNQRVTATTVSSSLPISGVGQSVTFTAQVDGYNPTGSIAFKEGAARMATVALSSGTARFTTSSLGIGDHSITAEYSGDTNNTASISAPITQVVRRAATTTDASSSLPISRPGQSVTFTAIVTGYNPTGTVIYKDTGRPMGSATLSGGAARFTTSSLTEGHHLITAEYGGDTNNSPSVSAPVNQVVTQRGPTTTIINSSLPISRVGQPVTFTARVTGANPTGAVKFKDGGVPFAEAVLDAGAARFTTAELAAGRHLITAEYSGDLRHDPSESLPLNQIVNRALTSTTLESSAPIAMQGQPVTFTATVDGVNPTGTVTFWDGDIEASGAIHFLIVLGSRFFESDSIESGACRRGLLPGFEPCQLGTVDLSQGIAVFTTSALGLGEHTITAVYSGDSENNASSSSPITQTITINIPVLLNTINNLLFDHDKQ